MTRMEPSVGASHGGASVTLPGPFPPGKTRRVVTKVPSNVDRAYFHGGEVRPKDYAGAQF